MLGEPRLARRRNLLRRIGALGDAVPAPVSGGHPVEAPELVERLAVVVHPEVEDALVRRAARLGGDDDQARRLSSPKVAARRLRPVQRRQQALRKRSRGRGERLGHRRPDLVRAQHVALDAEPGALEVARVRDAPGTGVRRRPSLAVDVRDLPHVAQVVLGQQPVERGSGLRSVAHERQPVGAVAALGERLRRDGADAGKRPRARSTRAERARLDGDADLAGLGVPGHDRVRHRLGSCTTPTGPHRERDGQMVSEIRSAIATVVTFVFARGMVGMIDASATTRSSTPSTRPAASTTRPIPHVPAGWK